MAFQSSSRLMARQLQVGGLRPFSSLQNTASSRFMLRRLPLAGARTSTTPLMMVVRRDLHTSPASRTAVPNLSQSKNMYNPQEIDFMRARVHTNKLYHYSSIGLAVAVPAGLILSPGIWMLPIDTTICTLLAAHAWFGGRSIAEDYAPKHMQSFAKVALAVLVLLTYMGLLRVTWGGRGLCESFKSLWRSGPLDDSQLGMRPNLHGVINHPPKEE